MNKSLESLVFISLKDNTDLSALFPGFDSALPIPVQLASAEEQFSASKLSKESILSGILAVLAWDKNNEHIEYYRSIIQTAIPTIEQDLTETGIFQAKNGDFELAEEIFLSLHGLNPTNSRTILNLALLFDEKGESLHKIGLIEDAEAYDDTAFYWYKQAMLAEPPLTDAFFNAAYFFLRLQNYKKAKEAFETYIKIETKTDELTKDKKKDAQNFIDHIQAQSLDDDLFKSAYDFILMNQEEKALEKIREFLEYKPKVWNAWFLLGWALRKLNRWQDAKQAFLQCIELASKEQSTIGTAYADMCNEISICCMELGELTESRKWLEAGLAQDCENTKIITNLGMLALKQGNKEEAKGFFKTSLEIDPNDVFAKELLESM